MKIVNLVACVLVLLTSGYCQSPTVLSSADFTANVVSTYYANANVVGLSMYFQDLLPYWKDPLFKSRMNISMFDYSFSNAFYQTLHVGKGYKYGCNSSIYNNLNVTCLLDISLNTSLTSQMYSFIWDTAGWLSYDLGYDMEKSNFTNSKYLTNFKTYMNIFSSDGINLELADEADQYSAIYNRTYTAANFMTDISTIQSAYYGLYTNGPGITEAADSSWVAQIHNQVSNYRSVFTFRCMLFKNSSQASIAALLSENSSSLYLKNRLMSSTNMPLDLSADPVGINEIRLTNDSGIDGITNSFAAALWALDISLEFASLAGIFINFYNPLTPSNQSVFGAGPSFNPGAIYYGLLMAGYAVRDQPLIDKVTVVSGASGSIKIYGLDDYYYGYRIVLINKDLNESLNGVVNIKHAYQGGLRCYYLTAPHLNSTNNITFAGMYFTPKDSNYAGHFAYVDYQQLSEQTYAIKLGYAQAAICEDIPSPTEYTPLIRGRSRNLTEDHLALAFLVLILALLY